MTTKRRNAVAVPGLALVAFLLVAGGCGSIFETNQAACVRILNHFESCIPEVIATDEIVSLGGIDLFDPQYCDAVSETDDDLSAIADCLTSISCAQMSGEEPIDLATSINCLAAFQAR